MRSAANIQRILVPHDFSPPADHALDYALAMAKRLNARVLLVHAYEAPTYGFPDSLVAFHEFASVMREGAEKAIERVALRARNSGVTIETSVRQGTPWVEIANAAVQWQADIIVMGTHGRRGVSHLLLGSVAEKVVRTAPCPVLTVHLPETTAEAAGAG